MADTDTGTETAGDILDGLGADFPQQQAGAAALTQSLEDVLGDAVRGSAFAEVFFDVEDDGVLMEVAFVTQPLVLAIPGFSSFTVSVGQADELELELAAVFDQTGARLLLFDAPIYIRCSSTSLLTPVVKNGDKWEPDVEADGTPKKLAVVLDGVSLEIDSGGNVALATNLTVDLPPVRIGKSGVVVELRGVRLCMSDDAQLPDGVPAGSRGFAVDSIDVYLPESIQGSFVPGEIVGEGLFVGSGGFTGKLSAEWTQGKPLRLAGIECTLQSLMFEFRQNSLVGSELKCELTLPFFERPVNLDISFSGDGSLLASLSAVQPEGVDYDNGLIHFEKEDVFKATIDGMSFGVKDGVSILSVSGSIQPTFLSKGGQTKGEAPTFKIRELSVDSRGHVNFDGGWMELPEQYSLDFSGFKVGITKLGFGKTEDGGKWIGFSGGLKLVDGFTAGASVEGLRITWYEDGRQAKVSFNGIGVEFEIRGVLRFKGAVSYRELLVEGEEVRRFDGDITLELVALKLEIDAKLVVGSASGPQGRYNFFAIYLGVELPTGIPLSPIPLSLYGFAGLFALQMEPNKKPAEEWYDGWYKRADVGVTDLKDKWGNRRGSLALGCGVTIGTTDNGFTFNCKALLVFVFPGPIIMLEGKANLLKDRAELADEPMFRSLAVLDMRQKMILIGLDARYKQDETTGNVIDIRAGVEAYFHDPGDWHVYVGEREPREKRVRADIFKLFEANSYFMIDPKRLATGAWVGYARRWQYGPVGLTLEAWLEGNAIVNWNPLHFHGDLWLHGQVEVKVFKFSLGLSVDALFAADLFDPYHLVASFEISVRLPKPLKEKSFDITLEWGPRKTWPSPLPSPLKEVAVEHFKSTTSWPLDAHTSGGPPTGGEPVMPLDCRPHVSFRRPVHDDALAGVNPQPPQPAFELIGDSDKNEGPARVRYGLKEVSLLKWEPQAQQWRGVAAAVSGRPLAAGERKLYGSWAATPQLPSGKGQPAAACDKLWLWSKNPFYYTRHGGSEGDDWFTANFPTYPCVPQDVPDREVCCDFERLDRTHVLQTPWRSPEHPEITLIWPTREPRRVTILRPADRGFTRALCFEPSPTESITVGLSEPAKRVTILLAAAKKTGKVCLDFRKRERSQIRLPYEEQGVIFGAGAAATTVGPSQTTLGSMMGLLCSTAPVQGTPPPGLTVTLPCAATSVELLMSYQTSPTGSGPPTVAALNSAGETIATHALLNPVRQPEVMRFEGQDIKRVRISNTTSTVFLHKLCFNCPDTAPRATAEAFDREGRRVGGSESRDDVIEVRGDGVTQVRLRGAGEVCLLKVCVVFGPDPREVSERKEMAKHLKSEVARWSQEGEVLEPFSTYRLRVVTTTDAFGEGELSGQTQNFPETTHFDFRTEGPPGLTKLSVPAGQNPDKFDSGLEDLTRYVRQTTPATVPPVGEKPMMAKPFYRAYDVGVDFNEDYVDLMYRISGRDLGLYLYDNNNRPVCDAEGRLLTQGADWGAVEELTLSEGEQRWLALAASGNRCLPAIEESSILHDKKLTSAVASRVLEPDTVYEARLIPLLLREGFAAYATGSVAVGLAGGFGRWRVHDEGTVGGPSHWEVRETTAPVAKYLIETSGIKGGSGDPEDPFKPGTLLLYGDDPALSPAHAEQPSNWTDYRLSVYLRADSGTMGVVFRYRGPGDYYRVLMDGVYRRLVKVAAGAHTVLAEDEFEYEPQRDYLLTVEVMGEALRVYVDGATVFDVSDFGHAQGRVGLYAYDNTGARFADVRVDDFRRTAPVVYRFHFTTSLFANFFHHLHSYQDETWRVVVDAADVASALPALGKAVPPDAQPTDEEARTYETLATALLGQAARQNPREVQVTRVDVSGVASAYLVQSPEPIDWHRTALALLRTDFARTELGLPGSVKLAAVTFGEDRTSIESVALLLREPLNLTGYRIESRLALWPLSTESGVVIDAQTLSPDQAAETAWTTYGALEEGKNLPAGTTLRISPAGAAPSPSAETAPVQLVGLDAGDVEPWRRVLFSRELRVVAPDGKVVHARHFLPDDDYDAEDVRVLRKADGTGFFMVKPSGDSGGASFTLGQYRLKLTYRRDNSAFDLASRILSQDGDGADEVVTLDIPLQTQ